MKIRCKCGDTLNVGDNPSHNDRFVCFECATTHTYFNVGGWSHHTSSEVVEDSKMEVPKIKRLEIIGYGEDATTVNLKINELIDYNNRIVRYIYNIDDKIDEKLEKLLETKEQKKTHIFVPPTFKGLDFRLYGHNGIRWELGTVDYHGKIYHINSGKVEFAKSAYIDLSRLDNSITLGTLTGTAEPIEDIWYLCFRNGLSIHTSFKQ